MMNDLEVKAREIVEEFDRISAFNCAMAMTDHDWLTEQITQALRDVREEDARKLCMYCNDPAWPPMNERGVHISPLTGSDFVCKAAAIRNQGVK